MSQDLTKKLQSQDEKLTVILTTVQSLTVRFDSIDSRLQRVEQTVDDARPVLQLLVTNVAQLQEGQRRLEEGYGRLEEGYGRLEEGYGRLEEGYGRLEEGYGRLEEGYGRLEEGQRRLEERCGSLEGGQKRLRSDLTDFRRHVDLQFRTLSGEVEGRYREHDQRIARLETNANPPNTET
jgi:chromosome segregation ATPase